MTSAPVMSVKQRAALISSLVSAGMAIAKLVAGLLTGSIGLLSEAAHALLDLGATLITFAAVRVSDKPADDDHPYGHGKIESVAALSETALLFVTAVGITWEAVERLQGAPPLAITWWSLAIVAASILVDITRSRSLHRIAKETRSQALEADALHFATDILSSSLVLVGLALAWAGYPAADALAGVGVAGFIVIAGWRLGRRTIDSLIDTAPAGIAERVTTLALRTPGVVAVRRVRARPAGSIVQIELEAGVARTLSVDRIDEVRRQLDARIQAAMPEAELSIAAYGVALDDESLRERVMMVAAYHGLAIHHVTVQRLAGTLSIGLDLEVAGVISLGAAHETASRLEAAIRGDFGDDVEVETHIEPMDDAPVSGAEAPADLVAAVAGVIDAQARANPAIIDTHAVRVRLSDEGLHISFHCTFGADCSVDFAHDSVSRIEARLREQWPRTRRILAHAEPPER